MAHFFFPGTSYLPSIQIDAVASDHWGYGPEVQTSKIEVYLEVEGKNRSLSVDILLSIRYLYL